MGLKFVLLVNKQGQTRLAKYGDQSMTVEERRVLEGEIVRKCLARAERQVSLLKAFERPTQDIKHSAHEAGQSCLRLFVQCSFVEHRNYKVIYRRYASLFFLVGIDNDEVSAHRK